MQLTFRTCLFGLLALAGAALTWYFNIRFCSIRAVPSAWQPLFGKAFPTRQPHPLQAMRQSARLRFWYGCPLRHAGL